MGYDYFVIVALKDLDKIDIDRKGKKFKKAYQFLLSEDDCYPEFGVVTRGLFSTNGTIIEKYLKLFTTKFPNKTFIFYYFWYDAEFCEILTIKDDEIISRESECLVDKTLKIGKNKVYFRLDLNNITVDNNITILFNDKYYYNIDNC